MFEELKAKAKRYDELQGFLATPEVAADTISYQKYARELSSLKSVVKKYNEYLKVQGEIDSAAKLLQGDDPDLRELAKTELAELKGAQEKLYGSLEELLYGEEPDSDKSCIVEVRAGTGGLEASLFAAELFKMYARYAANNGFKVDVMNTHVSEAGGFKEVIFAIEGNGAYRKFKYESGVHRVQRVPVTEASGRIHTSTATVAVLPEAEEVEVKIDPKELRIDVFRATGPGGQGVNTTDSAVRITHIPSGVVVSCQDERSQMKNKAKALKVLRARLWDFAKQEEQAKRDTKRRSQIGSGDRSEKIRTYNFPQRRITDHRVGFTTHRLEEVLEGAMGELFDALNDAQKKLTRHGHG